MMDIPTIEHPTNRANYTAVTVGGVTYYFSYSTLIAFNAWDGSGPVVRKNEWGPTTSGHMRAIDHGDKESRVDAATFVKEVARLELDAGTIV